MRKRNHGGRIKIKCTRTSEVTIFIRLFSVVFISCFSILFYFLLFTFFFGEIGHENKQIVNTQYMDWRINSNASPKVEYLNAKVIYLAE